MKIYNLRKHTLICLLNNIAALMIMYEINSSIFKKKSFYEFYILYIFIYINDFLFQNYDK